MLRVASLRTFTAHALFATTLVLAVPAAAQVGDPGTLKLSESEKRQRIARLSEAERSFLHLARPIMPDAELDAFLLLEDDESRNDAMEAFWEKRAAGEPVEEWQEKYEARFDEASQLFESRTSDRAQVYLLRGRPSAMMPVPCADYFLPIEVWSYDRLPGLDDGANLLFYRPRPSDPYQLLVPDEEGDRPIDEKILSDKGKRIGPVPIILGIPDRDSEVPQPLALRCPAGRELLDAIELVKRAPNRIAELLDRSVHSRRKKEAEPRLTLHGSGENPVSIEASVSYPGKRGGRTVASLRLKIDPTRLTPVKKNPREFYAVRVRGEVRDGPRVIDRFRYDYEIPTGRDELNLVIERFLPPYDYELVVHLEDQSSDAEGIVAMPIEVPYYRPSLEGDLGEERAAVIAEMEQDFRSGESSIRLIPLGTGFFTGRQRFETLLTGDQIESVEFYVDDRKVMSKREPPYTLELDLGDIPLMTTIRVVGRDHLERIVSGDELVVNAGSDPFRVRIISPRVSQGLSGETRVEVEASIPAEYELEKIELYLDDDRIAIGYETPLIQTVDIPSSSKTTYLRAVATINDEIGSKVEDVVLLNAPDLLEEVDVRLVELPTTVMRRGEVVDDLSADAFQVFDEGKPVEIDKFDYVRDLPLSIGMAIDSSGSMRPRMTQALRTGARFFQRVLKPGDRAFLLAFNDEPRMIQGWTDSLASLTAGLASLDAEEMTALHDAVIHSLYNFQGLRGQKALIVLSDGQDTASDFSFAQVLEYARRGGIPIYTIGIGIRRGDMETRSKLVRLAEETGAESYFIEVAGGLSGIYDEIEKELRSQYILGFYPSPSARDSNEWRRVEVKVEGASAKTVRGYYP